MINKQNLETIEKYRIHRYSLGKRDNTVKTDVNAIRKLGKHIGNKSFEKASSDDLKSYFIDIKNFILRDHYASRIICFYKWMYKLGKKERPENMEWYVYSNKKDRKKQKKTNLKDYLITPDEYQKIIQHVRMDLRMSALYETLYLSGGRPDEICNMKIENVLNENGNITIVVPTSKTEPREIPLTEKPGLLLRWVENHPYNDNKDAWLFPSLDRRFKDRHIQAGSVSDKFKKLVKDLNLKSTLILYSFRKTRATTMFDQGYDEKEMGMLFGWEPHTVIDRREEYDLRGIEDLKAKIHQKAERYKTREELEEENKNLFAGQEKVIIELQQEMDRIRKELLEVKLKQVQELQRENNKKN